MAALLPNDPATLRAVKALADYFHADPKGILAIWNSESGLQPRLGPVSGYYGLIMAMPSMVDAALQAGSMRPWAAIVMNGSIVEQIAAIKQIWDSSAKTFLHESVATRAKKLGVRGETVLYSLNFVPAYFAKMTSATQPMIVKDGGPDGGQFYHDNPGFDLDGKGYITVLDVQKRIDRMMASGMNNTATASLFKGVSDLLPFRLLGTLGSAGVGAILGSTVFPGIGTALGAGLGVAAYGALSLGKKWIGR